MDQGSYTIVMNGFDVIAVFVTLAAICGYLNFKLLKLPMTIGIMLLSLLGSLVVVVWGSFSPGLLESEARALVETVDFNLTLMHGMLSFLLFAGALHVNLADLRRQGLLIAILATVGTVGSTFVNGFLAYWVLDLIGAGMPLIYCLLFGALISPTDPIAVIGILRRAGAPKSLETKIVGESLFNDGVAVVVFVVLLEIAVDGGKPSLGGVSMLLLEEGGGGVVLGLVLGLLGVFTLRSLDDYSVEVLITLALVMGGYALSFAIHVSGPLAMVVAGLIIGNHGRRWAMSDHTREHVDTFWKLLDEILNAVLFVLIGVEVLLVSWNVSHARAVAILIPAILLCRFFWVGVPVSLLRRVLPISTHAIKIITWAGIRGGISVALALSLPAGSEREFIVSITYGIVVFSVVVQGLTVGPLLRRLSPQPE